MKKLYSLLTALVIGGLVCAPQSLSQERGRKNYGGGHRTEQRGPDKNNRPSRPGNGNNSRPGNHGNGNRPNNGSNRPDNGFRPGNGGNHKPDNGYRPGNGGNHRPDNGFRPGNGGNHRPDNGYRPGNGNHRPDNGYRPGGNHKPNHGFRPGSNHRPEHGYRPGGHRPNHNWRPPYHHRPPRIPGMYVRPWHRPVPPPGFRPRPGGPRFSTILGITLGTAINLSLNALINGGYTVTGYGPSAVYLTGVNLYGCYWPNATLNYVNSNLRGSEFVYSTYGYDRSRYDMLYRQMTNTYGVPIATNVNGARVSATWWGYNNSYISLNYFPDYDADGIYRYYTVLSIGD